MITIPRIKFPLLQICKSERGASLMELAIILPIVMMLIAGMVDFGLKLNNVKTVASAARNATRTAASFSKNVLNPMLCGEAIDNICPAQNGGQQIASNTLTGVAHEAACNYMSAAGYSPGDWRVTVPEPFFIAEAGKTFPMIRVTVQRESRDCFVCYDSLYEAFRTESSASFVLEGGCR